MTLNDDIIEADTTKLHELREKIENST